MLAVLDFEGSAALEGTDCGRNSRVELGPADKITAESSPETIERWDSVQHLNLVLALEEKVNVQFEPEDIEQMKNIGAVATLVEKRQSATH